MIALAIITARFAHDRVADQFADPDLTAAGPRVPVRRAAARAAADRPEPAPRTA